MTLLRAVPSPALGLPAPAPIRELVNFVILSTPKTKGSSRGFVPRRADGSIVKMANGAPMVVNKNDAGDAGGAWLKAVSDAALEARTDADLELLDGPLGVDLTYVFTRPKSHYGAGRNAGVLKDSAPRWPTTKSDVDKLERAILDGCKGVLWRDDKQVVECRHRKVFGDPALAFVRIFELEATAGEARAEVLEGEPAQAALAL